MKKTVLITGSSSGIGRATALKFQQAGWNVVATMRSPEKENLLNTLDNVICPALDVHDANSIMQAVELTREHFGGLDVVVNNAGYGLIGAFETFSQEQVERQFKTNVFGLMNMVRAVLPLMRESKQGSIINIASFAGRSTVPLYSVYHASKWAVEGFVNSLAYEVDQFNIRLKIVEPGTVKTGFLGRSADRNNTTGINAYDAYSQPVLKRIDNTAGLISVGPEAVAKTIFRAANDDSRRLRYVVGADARITLLARKLLPDTLYDAAIRAVFHSNVLSGTNMLKPRPGK